MVKTRSLWIAALLLLMCSRVAPAQDLTGDWQGTLSVGQVQLRLILHVDNADDTTWKATLASIDQSPDWGAGVPVDSVTVSETVCERRTSFASRARLTMSSSRTKLMCSGKWTRSSVG